MTFRLWRCFVITSLSLSAKRKALSSQNCQSSKTKKIKNEKKHTHTPLLPHLKLWTPPWQVTWVFIDFVYCLLVTALLGWQSARNQMWQKEDKTFMITFFNTFLLLFSLVQSDLIVDKKLPCVGCPKKASPNQASLHHNHDIHDHCHNHNNHHNYIIMLFSPLLTGRWRSCKALVELSVRKRNWKSKTLQARYAFMIIISRVLSQTS